MGVDEPIGEVLDRYRGNDIHTFLTGWEDRDAVGPYGTITDSLSPRYVALLITAALLHRDRTGEGQYLDVSQIETAVYSLSDMVVRYSANGEVVGRRGNASEDAAPVTPMK